MRLYLRQGEVGVALRQYHQFENQLRQELGILPSPETRGLYEEILRKQGGPVSSTTLHRTYNAPIQSPALCWAGRPSSRTILIGEEVKAGHGVTVLI